MREREACNNYSREVTNRIDLEISTKLTHSVTRRTHRARISILFASSVSPDTVSVLNVSTRFYLGVHAVRNIAYGSRRLALALA